MAACGVASCCSCARARRARRGAPRLVAARVRRALAARCSARSCSRASTSGRRAARGRARGAPRRTGDRLGSGLLGAAVAAKLYPARAACRSPSPGRWRRARPARARCVVPRRSSRPSSPLASSRSSCSRRDGVWDSLGAPALAAAADREPRRGALLVAHHVRSARVDDASSHGSQNLAGTAALGAAASTSVAQLGRARRALWVALRARPGRPRAARALRGGGASSRSSRSGRCSRRSS